GPVLCALRPLAPLARAVLLPFAHGGRIPDRSTAEPSSRGGCLPTLHVGPPRRRLDTRERCTLRHSPQLRFLLLLVAHVRHGSQAHDVAPANSRRASG